MEELFNESAVWDKCEDILKKDAQWGEQNKAICRIWSKLFPSLSPAQKLILLEYEEELIKQEARVACTIYTHMEKAAL